MGGPLYGELEVLFVAEQERLESWKTTQYHLRHIRDVWADKIIDDKLPEDVNYYIFLRFACENAVGNTESRTPVPSPHD